MTKSFDKKLLLWKIESNEGVDAVPTEAADAILTRNLDATRLEIDRGVRQLDGQHFGARPSYPRQIRRPYSFEVEIAGAGGDPDDVPAWMKLNRVCGFDAGVVAADTEVVQTPISASIPSASAWPFYDNLKVAAFGSRGTFSMTFEDDEFPFFSYEMGGFPPAGLAAEATPSAVDLSDFIEPVLVNSANTTFSLGGFSPPLRRVVIRVGAIIEARSLVGPAKRMRFRNREMTFEALVEHPDLTSKNYYANIVSKAPVALSIVHGIASGNIVEVAAPRAQIEDASTPDEQGDLMQLITGRLLPSSGSGNDELTITSK